MKLSDLIAAVEKLSDAERQQLLSVLKQYGPFEVRDAGESYGTSAQSEFAHMKSVTLLLPDEIAHQAQAAGLLRAPSLEALLRRALQEQSGQTSSEVTADRRLVHVDERLVVEPLPSEPPIRSADISNALDAMEW